jgi:hypothetical protein
MDSIILIDQGELCLHPIKDLSFTFKLGPCNEACYNANYLYLIEEYDENDSIICTRKFNFSRKGYCRNGFERHYLNGKLIRKDFYKNDRKFFSIRFKL